MKEAKDEIAVKGIYYQYDSSANKNWKVFDKAIKLYRNKHLTDSIINDNEGQDNIFSSKAKARMLKGQIGRFDMLAHKVSFDSLKFKSLQFSNGYVPSKQEQNRSK